MSGVRNVALLLLAVSLPALALAATADEEVDDDGESFLGKQTYGPGASFEAICAATPPGTRHYENVSCSEVKLPKGKLALKPPYDELKLVLRDSDSAGEALLAIRIGQSWTLALLSHWSNESSDHGGFDVRAIKLQDVIPGGPPELLLTGTFEELGEGHERTHGATYDMLWVCSVGASGAPGCASVKLGMSYLPHEYGEGKRFSFKLSHKFDKAGKLTRKLKGKWPSAKVQGDMQVDRADFANTRGFRFP